MLFIDYSNPKIKDLRLDLSIAEEIPNTNSWDGCAWIKRDGEVVALNYEYHALAVERYGQFGYRSLTSQGWVHVSYGDISTDMPPTEAQKNALSDLSMAFMPISTCLRRQGYYVKGFFDPRQHWSL